MLWEPGAAADALWAKSDAGGSPVSLIQHLLDATAVAELLWDEVLAEAVRGPLDAVMDGRGRDLFRLLAGWHDLGKATPGFQGKVPALAARVDATGLTTRPETRNARWRHELGSAAIAREVLKEHWQPADIGWLWPLLAGHHGRVPRVGRLRPEPAWLRGDDRWQAVQHALAWRVIAELGLDVLPVPVAVPHRSRQLVLAGHLIMADWIASDERRFTGDGSVTPTLAGARERASGVLPTLGLLPGLRPDPDCDPEELLQRRFGLTPRPLQLLVATAAQTAPGLMIVEAPMGEGKTEAALLAVELLARKGGQDGVFFALPTQATSDPVYTRVLRWVDTFEPPVRVGLLHGKRAVNPQWRQVQRQTSFTGVCDDFDMADPYSVAGEHVAADPRDWFLGSKRGLLQPVAVGTVDQVLHAATRTKHVMLRHAGLAAGVLVIDEVHAYDVYMAQFLHESLRWASAVGVPVVLLSATLPPAAREGLVRAYAEGAGVDAPVPTIPQAPGYPAVLTLARSAAQVNWTTTESFRPSRPVAVTVLEQAPDEDDTGLVSLLTERLAGGGIALVLRNTVGRAQQSFRALRQAFPDQVSLLHARLTTGARVDRAENLLRLLGPNGASRPYRLVVVATQVAEQSFDIDADLLVTDLAPIDLLLQRAGRLHRHDRPAGTRPLRVGSPEVVVTGVRWAATGSPALPGGSKAVYGEYLLLRAAALVLLAQRAGWDLPAEVPALVEAGYSRDDDVPAGWQERLRNARREQDERSARRAENAQGFLLSGVEALHRPTLAGLHDLSTAEVSEEQVRAVVRDGEESVEVTLLSHEAGGFLTVSGRPIGATGEAVVTEPSLLDEVAASSVRLPATPSTRSLNAAARDQLAPLAGWTGEPYLRNARALVLTDGVAELGGWRLTYDAELGLLHEKL